MSTGINKNGSTVAVNDSVSITARVSSVSGTGSKATVTVQAPFDASTFNIQANDAYTNEHQADANHVAVSIDGKSYGAVGNQVTAIGVVTAISGSGQNATLTVKLATSGNSISTAAGNVTSAQEVS
jgi:hypothetical protein